MHKQNKQNAQNKPSSHPKRYGFSYLSSRLCLIGLPIILLGLCDVAARLHDGVMAGEVGIMLHLSYDLECITAGLAILVGGALLLDYMERKDTDAK